MTTKPEQVVFNDNRTYVSRTLSVFDWSSGGVSLGIVDNENDVTVDVDLSISETQRLIERLQESITYQRDGNDGN